MSTEATEHSKSREALLSTPDPFPQGKASASSQELLSCSGVDQGHVSTPHFGQMRLADSLPFRGAVTAGTARQGPASVGSRDRQP